ncbi:MAG: HAD family phosphatase [Clostridia bacterium]|nr:HAD family phosphatase [Clostridia bacterium]
MIKAVFFDMDGVLLDSEPVHDMMLDRILSNLGADAEPGIRQKFIGASSEDLWLSMKNTFNLSMSIPELLDLHWETMIKMIPECNVTESRGLTELLKYLKGNGISVAIVSSSRRDFIEFVIDYLDIRKYLDYVVDGFQVQHGKPAPDIYLLAAKLGGFSNNECVVIEDSTNGVGAGKAAEMTVIGYDNPTSLGQDVGKADYIVKSMNQIIEIFEENKNGLS